AVVVEFARTADADGENTRGRGHPVAILVRTRPCHPDGGGPRDPFQVMQWLGKGSLAVLGMTGSSRSGWDGPGTTTHPAARGPKPGAGRRHEGRNEVVGRHGQVLILEVED